MNFFILPFFFKERCVICNACEKKRTRLMLFIFYFPKIIFFLKNKICNTCEEMKLMFFIFQKSFFAFFLTKSMQYMRRNEINVFFINKKMRLALMYRKKKSLSFLKKNC